MGSKLRRIVFVDDDEIIGMVTKRLLELMQLAEEVVLFSDSFKAFSYIKAEYNTANAIGGSNGDLIFLDIDMPGLGGFELLYMLKRLNRDGALNFENTTFAIVTAHKTEKEVRMASQYNVAAVLEKPLRKQEIMTLIGSLS